MGEAVREVNGKYHYILEAIFCFFRHCYRVSQSDSRIRRFLSLNYEEVANESNNKILIHASEGDETAWFVLRTNGEVISDVAGGTYEEIEDNVWLIGMEESSILITLKPSNTLFYYE